MGVRMRPRLWKFLPVETARPEPKPRTKGDEIRARIEANRRRRLAISDAMKAESGVVAHNVWSDEFSGVAELDTLEIHSPEGRNMRQLYIVAHECGHIFLHTSDPGRRLATHVMEMEAETYAHHAFRVHGMRVTRAPTAWAREYGGIWIERDRAAGIPIDPRAIAFAEGRRSPYSALRMIPDTWIGAGVPVEQPAAGIDPGLIHVPQLTVFERIRRGAIAVTRGLWHGLLETLELLGTAAVHTLAVTVMVLQFASLRQVFAAWLSWPLDTSPWDYNTTVAAAVSLGLVWACLAISFKLFKGRPARRRHGTADRREDQRS